jgi:uncharacterized protein YndB with AHSA1/START domain
MTVVADFPVPLQRLWDAYADPRQLERFWGPPTYPARFLRHDMVQGGRSEYVMTGPDGDVSRGYWEYLDVQPMTSFEVRDGFAHPDGTPNTDMPSVHLRFAFRETAGGSQVSTTTSFGSVDELDHPIGMGMNEGMDEGMPEAMAQMDAVLADLATFAASQPCEAQVLSDTQVRLSRVIRGSVEQVWASTSRRGPAAAMAARPRRLAEDPRHGAGHRDDHGDGDELRPVGGAGAGARVSTGAALVSAPRPVADVDGQRRTRRWWG